jgi:hypothetical protein
MKDEQDKVIAEFKAVVNMTAGQIRKWLETDESKQVGFKSEGEGESVGHHSGRRIIEILDKKTAEYTEADLRHMAKVVGYVHRHQTQRPEGNIAKLPGGIR